MSKQQKQEFDESQRGYYEEEKKIESEFIPQYRQILPQIVLDIKTYENTFAQNYIAYIPNNPYQKFGFDVERVYHSFPFYKVRVKMGHFSLTVTVGRNLESYLQQKQSCIGSYGTIFFANFHGKQICIKSFSFQDKYDFQKVFLRAIREWSILKICSALQCAPNVENYFGFDIIIYDDCVQFACEKGLKITHLTPTFQRQLKEALSIMHMFKIIHFDVKPDNIIFSQHLGKAVFIDFGFSQVVKEDFGFKTYILYKGTPNFCSPQLLEIMLLQKAYVDAYYNDAYGLIQSINFLGSEIQIIDESMENGQNELNINQEINSKHRNEIFLFLNFNYHFLNKNINESKFYIQQLRKMDQNNISKILLFIKSIVKDIFIPVIFAEDLKQFQYLIEYAQISHQVKLLIGNGFPNTKLNRQAINEDAEGDGVQIDKFEPLSFNGNLNFRPNFKDYMKLIFEIQSFQEEKICYFLAIAFESLRFDKKNISFQSKIALARKITPLLYEFMKKYMNTQANTTVPDGSKKDIEKIRQLMMLLLNFCLHYKSAEKWIKRKIFDIFQQIILLGIDFFPLIDSLFIFINNNFRTDKQRILAALECSRLNLSITMLDNQHIQRGRQNKYKLVSFTNAQLRKFMEKNTESQDQQNKIIKSIFDITSNLITTLDLQAYDIYGKSEKYLEGINDERLKSLLFYHISSFKQRCLITTMRIQDIQKQISIIHRPEYKNMDFLIYVQTLLTLNYITNFTKRQYLLKMINDVVDCEQVMSNFINFSRVMGYQKNIQILINRLSKLRQYYKRDINIDNTPDSNLYAIIYSLKSLMMPFDETIKKVFMQIYQLYKQSKHKKIIKKVQDPRQFILAYQRVQVQSFILQLSPQTRDQFLQSMEENQLILNKLEDVKGVLEQLYYIYINFKSSLYRSKLFKLVMPDRFSLQLEMQIYTCKNLHLHQLVLKLYKQLIQSCFNSNNNDLSFKYSLQFYRYCEEINTSFLYLQGKNMQCTVASMIIFARNNKTIFIDFLVTLINFVNKSPSDGYVEILISALYVFSQKCPMHSQLLHQSNFVNSVSLKNNPYLLIFYIFSLHQQSDLRQFQIIASNIDKLSQFAIQLLLSKYFFMLLKSIEKKDKRKHFKIFRTSNKYLSKPFCRQVVKMMIKQTKKMRKNSSYKSLKAKQKLKKINMNL